MHNLKIVDYVFFGGITNWGLGSQGDSLSGSSKE